MLCVPSGREERPAGGEVLVTGVEGFESQVVERDLLVVGQPFLCLLSGTACMHDRAVGDTRRGGLRKVACELGGRCVRSLLEGLADPTVEADPSCRTQLLEQG